MKSQIALFSLEIVEEIQKCVSMAEDWNETGKMQQKIQFFGTNKAQYFVFNLAENKHTPAEGAKILQLRVFFHS